MASNTMDAAKQTSHTSQHASLSSEGAILGVAAPTTDDHGVVEYAEHATEMPAYLTNNPSLVEFFNRLPSVMNQANHTEMYGVTLKGSDDIPTVIVLMKFLRANNGNLDKAENHLRKVLEWRRDAKPLDLIESGHFSASKYAGLGYLTVSEQDGHPLVITWNIYGAAKDVAATFGNFDEFVQWSVTLMEMAVQELKMKDATTVIEYDGENDPYKMVQVHDYLNVKFLRMDPKIRAATKKTIAVFATAYPELLREKYLVNTPGIMEWVFEAMKRILSRNTVRKFHPITKGIDLASEFPAAVAENIPKTYGGNGAELKDGARTVPLVENEEVSAGPTDGQAE